MQPGQVYGSESKESSTTTSQPNAVSRFLSGCGTGFGNFFICCLMNTGRDYDCLCTDICNCCNYDRETLVSARDKTNTNLKKIVTCGITSCSEEKNSEESQSLNSIEQDKAKAKGEVCGTCSAVVCVCVVIAGPILACALTGNSAGGSGGGHIPGSPPSQFMP